MFEFTPLGAVTQANGSGNATDLGKARVVYISSTSESVVTLSNGGSFRMPSRTEVVVHKAPAETLYASSANVYFTKISYPRG